MLARGPWSACLDHVYEVRCHDCEVSFPPETRRCFYCGRPTTTDPPPGAGVARIRQAGGSGGASDFARFELEGKQESRGKSEQEIVEEEMQGGSPFRFGSTGLWIALALFAGAIRACFGS